LKNTAGDTVAYQALNADGTACASAQACPQFIRTGSGSLSNMGRNTLPAAPTNNLDLAAYKDLSFGERVKFRFGAQFSNVLNHAQFLPGANPGLGLGVNDVVGFNTTAASDRAFATPGKANFNDPRTSFGSSARTIGLIMKLTF
jgi:hypothetical protein